jgi:diaminohydroxyphosphoribosylaminopyrimidine deaminase/5-amino-6-(5-phosphoribosylamino)uracil reductase
MAILPVDPAINQGLNLALNQAMALALKTARPFVGATAPNPPVGAVALNARGEILSAQAHQKAGTAHAEAAVLKDLEARSLLHELHTMVVTLEPCNHQGRTPPCTEALIRAGAKRVVYGAKDPNPHVTGSGAERLRAAGIETCLIASQELAHDCEELIRSFAYWSKTGLPWVTLKSAINAEGSMIPPRGQKTFTSPESLKLAHELRKRADAIITGSGTILADLPEFTVRHVPDHPGKSRWLIVLDRGKRTPKQWIQAAENRGFRVRTDLELNEAIEFLGKNGCLEVLIEAGPLVTDAVLRASLWNEHVVIKQENKAPEAVKEVVNVHRNHSKNSTRGIS